MNEPVIQANESLVRNGDFNNALSHWTRKGLVGVDADIYEGWLTNFMDVGVGGVATQTITVPKKPDTNARYELTFLCELRTGVSWSGDSGWLRILKGGDVLMSIELKKGASRNVEQDQAHLAAGQPLVFIPIAYQASLDELAFDSGDELSVQISGVPANPSDNRSTVCITRIDLQLKLEPLKLQAICLDQEVLTPGQTLYLCLGASLGGGQGNPSLYIPHNLSFVPEAGNAWLDTQVALTSPGNPLDAVKAVPDWGVNHEVASPWSLDCPMLGEEKSYDFSINLINQYNAEPYSIDVSLGHHRVGIRESQEAAYYPVFEYGQSVRLGVQVISFYTSQALDGRRVTWASAGQGVLATGTTNEQGWVYHDFAPSHAGDFIVTASVDSPYYASGEVTHAFEVTVLATDPWKDLRAVVENAETPWEVTGYPNRGSDHPFIMRLPAESPLRGTDLSLHWSGAGHEQLGVTVSPALREPVPFDGEDIVWTLTSEDRLDGRFELSLVCSKLLLPSPGKPMSLARNRVKVGAVREANKFPLVDESEGVLLRVQAVHDVAGGDGDPVSNALVEWQIPDGDTVYEVTGSGGWASVLYTPKTVGEKIVTARLKAHPDAVSVERPFTVTAIDTSPWKNQVSIWLDDVEVERNSLGLLCRRGQTSTLKVVPQAGSEWIDQNISLHWRGGDPDIGLKPADLASPKPLSEAGVEWKLVSEKDSSLSSLFELELRLENLPSVRELSGRLMAEDLTEEVALMFDQIRSALDAQKLYPCLGAVHRFNVLPHALSPLVGLEASLTWSGTPVESLGATVKPVMEYPQTLSDGGANWTLDFTASPEPGEFALTLALPQLNFEAVAKPMALAHNKVRFEASRESAVDPVIGQEPAWMWVQVYSHFTGRPVDQAPVNWIIDEKTSHEATTADGWSGFAFAPQTVGEQWVTASLLSPYDGYEERLPIKLLALDEDPWSGLTVEFDGQAPQPWGQKTYFPRRNGTYRLTVKAEQGNALLDRQLTLGMTGTGPRPLGIQFTPSVLGIPKLFSSAGFSYDFTVADLTDGGFALCLASERLASLSPANAMSLGRGEQVVKIAERQRVNQTLLWGEAVTERVTVISVVSGRPMVGVTVTWRSPDLGLVTSTTNFYGVAKIDFLPTTPGAFELTATVGNELYSDSVSLAYFLSEPRQINALVVDEPGGYPGQLMTAQAWVVSAKTGEPMADVEVMWEYDNTLIPATLTDAKGMATCSFTFGTPDEALWASVKGGLTGWDVKALQLNFHEPPAAVASVVASPNPVPLQTYVTMTALIVGKESGEPMPKRTIQVSNNGGPFIQATTDHKGQYASYWRPMSLTDNISLAVKLSNPDGSSDSGAVYVTVVS
ncbi:hypothetical protein PSH79_21480 [Pseudomonas sp. FP2196]|uniref:hypothetical protein n=1 Tax=Pseudomonas sp. FP2196 TaxID=2954086 RepID=UPI0027345CC4|nr:hypothetical protein [Pseudomonas sp. FP2196]WLH34477.1 hypothetical protein PSH79_21480 [Pseudomonas sp. FP2196]